jgi:hypothetical protein
VVLLCCCWLRGLWRWPDNNTRHAIHPHTTTNHPAGNTLDAIGSGIGFVHNTYLFDHPQKGVMVAPWTYAPQPLWSVGQLGLAAALPWAFKFMTSQHNPLLALAYLIMVAVHALRHSWRPAKKV